MPPDVPIYTTSLSFLPTIPILMNVFSLLFHEEFLCDVGIKKLCFKPAYNPYTEPSMEIFSYHEGLSAVLFFIVIDKITGILNEQFSSHIFIRM